MPKTLFACAVIVPALLFAPALAQPNIPEPEDWSDPAAVVEHYMEAAGIEPTEILLLGTFHFDDQGLDTYKPQNSFDPLDDDRQDEIEDVVDDLADWEPTMVCVERVPSVQDRVDGWYAEYRAGGMRDRRNEIVQIGFRLADQLEHEQVHAVDARGSWLEPRVDLEEYAKEHGQTDQLRPPEFAAFFAYAAAKDRFIDRSDLNEIFLFMNDPELIGKGHGVYLMGGFGIGQGDEYPGVDGFTSQWYNRNLKIFQNLRRLREPGGRMVVLIGAGHLPIIRHAIECSPEFTLVEVADVIDD